MVPGMVVAIALRFSDHVLSKSDARAEGYPCCRDRRSLLSAGMFRSIAAAGDDTRHQSISMAGQSVERLTEPLACVA